MSNNRAAPHYARLSKKFQAVCAANQPLVDKLAVAREKTGSSNYGYTLKRAAESIAKAAAPITTFDQAVELKGVGPAVARSLGFSRSFVDSEAQSSTTGGSPKQQRQQQQQQRKDPPSSRLGSRTSSISSVESASLRATRKHPPHKKTLASIAEKPSKKELAYQRALSESDAWKGQGYHWRLVLLIDQRERQAEHYASKVEQCGIPTEIRTLPIGDMCWIAQGYANDDPANVRAELMLGTIIERKEVADLKSSLFGTRYHEQQLRLQHSGQPQVIFLIEGDTRKDQYRCPAETLHSTMWAIRIEKQNQVIQTAHTEETVQTLRRLHRRMLQRTFPTAFYAEALPSFTDTQIGRQRRRDSFGEPTRKRRRRLQSLHGLVFDKEPVPMAGMARFVTYPELRAKIERDREAGRRTVGSIHQAMLKQVATISDVKIGPLSAAYPTANALLRAYDQLVGTAARETFLETFDYSSSGRKTLGPRSAAELAIAYGLEKNNDGQSLDSADAVVTKSNHDDDDSRKVVDDAGRTGADQSTTARHWTVLSSSGTNSRSAPNYPTNAASHREVEIIEIMD